MSGGGGGGGGGGSGCRGLEKTAKAGGEGSGGGGEVRGGGEGRGKIQISIHSLRSTLDTHFDGRYYRKHRNPRDDCILLKPFRRVGVTHQL